MQTSNQISGTQIKCIYWFTVTWFTRKRYCRLWEMMLREK